VLGALLVCSSVGFAAEKVIVPDLSKVNDATSWKAINASLHVSREGAKPIVRLQPKSDAQTPSNIAMALPEGLEFAEGTIEIELKGKDPNEASFLGIR